MADYLDYTLSNFLLFSAETFYRLFALYHRAIWPVQLTLATVLIALFYRHKKAPSKIVSAGLFALSLAFFWVGSIYHLQFYASINWAAHYFGGMFIVQACLLLLAAYRQRSLAPEYFTNLRGWVGACLLLYAVMIFPVIDILLRSDWRQAQLFGFTPDPTAIACLGVLLCCRIKGAGLLALIPTVWLLISRATAYTLAR